MFYDRLLILCDSRDVKLSNVVSSLGMSKGTIGNWKNGAIPSGEVTLRFAEYFNVSTDYLLTGKERTSPDNLLSPKEQLLLDLYRSSDPAGQERILEHAELIGRKYKK